MNTRSQRQNAASDVHAKDALNDSDAGQSSEPEGSGIDQVSTSLIDYPLDTISPEETAKLRKRLQPSRETQDQSAHVTTDTDSSDESQNLDRISQELLPSFDLNKEDLLVESYKQLGDGNQRLVDAFVEGLLRLEAGDAPDAEKTKKAKRRGGPDIAPLLYADRPDKSEKVLPFIIRVYGGGDPKGGWLDGNMTRADLRHIDSQCAGALNELEKRTGRVPLKDLNLPTVKEYNDALLALPSDSLSRDEKRRLQSVEASRRHEP
ncbi:hypothetical protein [uncultured Roseobacter sp.]|uniref:hypothetical protein n=1 Tax=uncultured Roseobacter sp. TaxID=114847 RepID=UPI00262FEA62|nr:hypothetical protein [uncultured Roseobacter sp.]